MTGSRAKPGERRRLIAELLVVLAGVVVLALYSPFDLPLQSDRAYLLYVTQVAYFNGDIYGNTSLGYTPLGSLIGAGVFHLASWVSDASTVMVIRVAGLLCWLACLLGLFRLGARFFDEWPEAIVMAAIFAGFSTVPLITAVNLEPKMLVVLFEIWALSSCHRRRWFVAGLATTFAAMCWQPAIVIAPFLGAFMLWDCDGSQRVRALGRFAAGLFAGSLPVLIYLTATRSWSVFWLQAVDRKLVLEGARAMERPTHWFTDGIFPDLNSEIGVFLLALVGLTSFLALVLSNWRGRSRAPRHAVLMILFTVPWLLFNSMEFERVPDLIPLLPAISYWPAYLLWTLRRFSPWPRVVHVAFLVMFVLALFDLRYVQPGLTLDQQRQELAALRAIDPEPLVFDFEEFMVLDERALRTKFIRFNRHDDYLIDALYNGGCEQLIDALAKAPPQHLLIRYRGARQMDPTGTCAKAIQGRLFEANPLEEFTISGKLLCLGCAPRIDTVLVYRVRSELEQGMKR